MKLTITATLDTSGMPAYDGTDFACVPEVIQNLGALLATVKNVAVDRLASLAAVPDTPDRNVRMAAYRDEVALGQQLLNTLTVKGRLENDDAFSYASGEDIRHYPVPRIPPVPFSLIFHEVVPGIAAGTCGLPGPRIEIVREDPAFLYAPGGSELSRDEVAKWLKEGDAVAVPPLRLPWTRPSEPTDQCSYHHVRCETALGDFLITWKGWKDRPSFDLDHLPFKWDGVTTGWNTLEDAQQWAEDAFFEQVGKLAALRNP